MDAVTSFELEAQRRQEIFESEAMTALSRANAVADEATVSHVARASGAAERLTPAGDCQPAPYARGSVG